MKWLIYLWNTQALRHNWRRVQDLPRLTDFLEYNPLFRNAALNIHKKKQEVDGKRVKVPSVNEILKKIDKKLEEELIYKKSNRK